MAKKKTGATRKRSRKLPPRDPHTGRFKKSRKRKKAQPRSRTTGRFVKKR